MQVKMKIVKELRIKVKRKSTCESSYRERYTPVQSLFQSFSNFIVVPSVPLEVNRVIITTRKVKQGLTAGGQGPSLPSKCSFIEKVNHRSSEGGRMDH